MSHPLLDHRRAERLGRARRLAWFSIAALAAIAVAMYLAMGSSQAMKTAWIEDLLSLAPPVAFLLAVRLEQRPPSERYPFGMLGAVNVAFGAAALALVAMGAWMLIQAVLGFASGDRPAIGGTRILGTTVWAGWIMIVVLACSAIVPYALGHAKESLARALNDATLYADAKMNRADWTTAVATAAGVLGVGLGWWWADYAAAGLVSLSILRDGTTNVSRAMAEVLDRRPADVEGRPLRLAEQAERALHDLPFVAAARVRCRQEGRFFVAEAWLEPRQGRALGPAEIGRARARVRALDWRLVDVLVTWGRPTWTADPRRPSLADRLPTWSAGEESNRR